MTKKHPNIEEQISLTISTEMSAAHREQVVVIKDTIQRLVNGKIDDFRKDQNLVNEAQNKSLDEIKNSVKGIIEVYDGSTKFFRVTKTASGWITAISAAILVVWAFIRFVVLSALPK